MVFEGTKNNSCSHFRKGTIHNKGKMDWHSDRERVTSQLLVCQVTAREKECVAMITTVLVRAWHYRLQQVGGFKPTPS